MSCEYNYFYIPFQTEISTSTLRTFIQLTISNLWNNKIAHLMSFPVASFYRLPINTGSFASSLLGKKLPVIQGPGKYVQPMTDHLSGVVIRSLPEA